MKKLIKYTASAIGAIAMSLLISALIIADSLPNNLYVVDGNKPTFKENLPLNLKADCSNCLQVEDMVKTGSHYTGTVKLLSLVPVKKINVSVVGKTCVIPCGYTFGVKLYTAGVVVVGTSEIETSQGTKMPAKEAGIQVGDVIFAINGKPVSSNSDVESIVSNCSGATLPVSLKRGNVGIQVKLSPVKSSSDGTYKAGLWVRDSTAGIGTVTFYNPDNSTFGGLGHGICDVDTGKLLPLMEGDIVKVHITGIIKGTKGQPGQLQGSLDNSIWGNIGMNTETGVYGTLNGIEANSEIQVAMPQDVHTGPAKIIATLDSSGPKLYSVEISRIHFNDNAPTKNMIIKVTDKALLDKTGGIIQGMSGCPIIQDGKLAGAVTHVFVNDPQMGYGIFAENMINTSKTLENFYQKDVS